MVSPSRVRCYTLLYTSLLLMAIVCPVWPASVPGKVRKRQLLAIPAIYIGELVLPSVFSYLVAAFGATAVIAAGITTTHTIHSDHDSHSCKNNGGWCRSSCFSHEKIDWAHSDVCGQYKCCVP